MKKQSPKQPAKRNAKRPAPVGNGETAQGAPSQAANPSGGNTDAAQGTAGEPVRQWHGKTDGETEAQYLRRAFEWDGVELSAMGAASWERWKLAGMVLHYGFSWAIENGAGYADILNRPEMLRAVECLINDPPEIAAAFLNPNPNPEQGGACSKDCREWILSTFRECVENDYLQPTGKTAPDRGGRGWLPVWDLPEKGTVDFGDLTAARFDMFPHCLNLAVVMLRQTWGEFVTVCGLPEFAEMREWLARDKTEAGRGYVEMPALYESAFSEEQYFDLNTGEVNAPKYGGGGIKARALLFNLRAYLRKRQAANGCAPVAEDRKPDAGAADRDAAARESLHGKPDAAQGGADLCGALQDLTRAIQAANLTGAPAKQKPAGNVRGLSQAKFAALLIHYGGKCHGEPYTARAVKIWDRETDKRPTAGGLKYTPELRRDIMGARIWAKRFNEENENAYKARKARI